MNFLAHAYLSFDDPKIILGNLIGDFVRGDLSSQFDKEIIQGIVLHREIDKYTDTHSTVKKAQLLLKPRFGRYASVITDMYFDYFLAKYWQSYDDRKLEDFAQKVYALVETYRPKLPDPFLHIFKYMKRDNWLVAYGTLEGIQLALTGISRRAKFRSNMEEAHLFLINNHDLLKSYFDIFFPDLIRFSKNKKSEIIKRHDPL